MSALYIVSTPIGNLSDCSQRALDALKRADLILAEDTRQTRKLLSHFDIKTPLLSYHQHSKLNKVDYILSLLKQGKALALVSDAGTPGIADPGNQLVEAVVKELGQAVKIIPIPGPCALTTAASVSGFPMDKFLFLGFPPAKNKRQKFFQEALASKYPVILYESPHRILKTLKELSSLQGKELSSFQNPLRLVVCRELTKLHETIYRGTAEEVISQLKKEFPTGPPKGEFVIILKKPS